MKILSICLAFLIAGCDHEERSETSSGIEASLDKFREMPAVREQLQSGDFIKRATEDRSLRREIRGGAKVFQQLITGERVAVEKEAKSALDELNFTRSEESCLLWLSFMLACEKNMPEKLPTQEEFRSVTEQGKEALSKSSFRFLDYYFGTLEPLTELNYPQADDEIAASLRRFKVRYGNSEQVMKLLQQADGVIDMAKKKRDAGRARWQLGREGSRQGTGLN